jgi:MFS-type transporter involved in bile tolerance (Atg22 family)
VTRPGDPVPTTDSPVGPDSEIDDWAGEGARDALNELDLADHESAQFVDGVRLDAGDDVVGARDILGHDDTGYFPDLTGDAGRLANFGLDQHVTMDGHGLPYIDGVPRAPKIEQFREMARQARDDLFDQSTPVGRLSLVQVAMLAGDTLVTLSLAGSLFFSISPTEAKSKVFYYLLFTLAPFAIVSPLLGPLIDRSRGARRAMVIFSAVGRAVLCPLMALHVHSLLLFPLAFLVLVLSKLYLVTRGALVPEVAVMAGPDGSGEQTQYATLNARLTLLGTVAGFVVAVPGGIIWKLGGSSALLWTDSFVFVGAAVAGFRLPAFTRSRSARPSETPAESFEEDPVDDRSADLAELQPIAHPEVLLGLSAMSIIRGLQGFQIFLLAFGLRRLKVGLYIYGLALSASGVGAIVGLVLLGRLRKRLSEQQLLLSSLWLIAVSSLGVAVWGTLAAQVILAFVVGLAGALAQPSFDAMTQRYIPQAAQGRAFARFATRQQLVWVLGALIPVVVSFSLPQGDAVMAALAAIGGLTYVTGRRAVRSPRTGT